MAPLVWFCSGAAAATLDMSPSHLCSSHVPETFTGCFCSPSDPGDQFCCKDRMCAVVIDLTQRRAPVRVVMRLSALQSPPISCAQTAHCLLDGDLPCSQQAPAPASTQRLPLFTSEHRYHNDPSHTRTSSCPGAFGHVPRRLRAEAARVEGHSAR